MGCSKFMSHDSNYPIIGSEHLTSDGDERTLATLKFEIIETQNSKLPGDSNPCRDRFQDQTRYHPISYRGHHMSCLMILTM